jgi:hypothetical protein
LTLGHGNTFGCGVGVGVGEGVGVEKGEKPCALISEIKNKTMTTGKKKLKARCIRDTFTSDTGSGRVTR